VNGPFGLFWKLLAGASLLWYVLLTAYVAVRGARDIRRMLSRLSDRS
jgi:hypothetical protein